MDPREKRDDESWAEYGARMATMGIAPEMASVPLAAAIRRPGRRGPRTLTPEQVAVRDANRQRVANQQLSRNVARSDAAYAREVPTKGVPLQEALAETPEEKARRVQAEKTQALSARKGTGVVKAIAPFAKAVPFAGGLYEALRSEPAVASELAPGVIPGDFRVTQAYPSMDNVYTDPTAMAAGIASVAEEWNPALGDRLAGLVEDEPGDWRDHVARSAVIEALATGEDTALSAYEADAWKGGDMFDSLNLLGKIVSPPVVIGKQVFEGEPMAAVANLDPFTDVPDRFTAFDALLETGAIDPSGIGDVISQVDSFGPLSPAVKLDSGWAMDEEPHTPTSLAAVQRKNIEQARRALAHIDTGAVDREKARMAEIARQQRISKATRELEAQAAVDARNAQMAQEAAARQQAIDFERMSNRLANLRGRDRGVDPSEVAALEAALGGYRGDPVGRQAGRTRGGFDPRGGETGSSGMGAWT